MTQHKASECAADLRPMILGRVLPYERQTMTETKLTLSTLKSCKGSVGSYYNSKAVQVAINLGPDQSTLYLTNSYALAPASRFAHIWQASNLEPAPGLYVLNGHVQPVAEGTPPNLEYILKGLPKAEIDRLHVAGRPIFVSDSVGDLLVFGVDTFTYLRRELVNVYIGPEEGVDHWTGDGPTKPVAAWTKGRELLGLVMPVRVS